jgi:hypothetical protein
VRLNVRSGSDDISAIVIKSRANQRVVDIEFLSLRLASKQSDWYSKRPRGDALEAIVTIESILLMGESSSKTSVYLPRLWRRCHGVNNG